MPPSARRRRCYAAPPFLKRWETCKKTLWHEATRSVVFAVIPSFSRSSQATSTPLAFLKSVGLCRGSAKKNNHVSWSSHAAARLGRWRCVVPASAAGEERGQHRGAQRSSHQLHANHRIKLAPGRPLRCTAPGAAPRKVISPESSKRWVWRVPPNQAGWIWRHFL